MKNSAKQKNDQTEGKRSWKHKVKPCGDLDGASRRDNAENLELRKKDEQQEAKNLLLLNKLRRKGLITWMKPE